MRGTESDPVPPPVKQMPMPSAALLSNHQLVAVAPVDIIKAMEMPIGRLYNPIIELAVFALRSDYHANNDRKRGDETRDPRAKPRHNHPRGDRQQACKAERTRLREAVEIFVCEHQGNKVWKSAAAFFATFGTMIAQRFWGPNLSFLMSAGFTGATMGGFLGSTIATEIVNADGGSYTFVTVYMALTFFLSGLCVMFIVTDVETADSLQATRIRREALKMGMALPSTDAPLCSRGGERGGVGATRGVAHRGAAGEESNALLAHSGHPSREEGGGRGAGMGGEELPPVRANGSNVGKTQKKTSLGSGNNANATSNSRRSSPGESNDAATHAQANANSLSNATPPPPAPSSPRHPTLPNLRCDRRSVSCRPKSVPFSHREPSDAHQDTTGICSSPLRRPATGSACERCR